MASRLHAYFPLPRTTLVFAFALFCTPATLAQDTPPADFADLAEQLTPTVVNIATTTPSSRQAPQFPPGSPFHDFFDRFPDDERSSPSVPSRALGSGFVIDEAGYIVTNNHVIDEANEITVLFSNGKSLGAEVVGRDPKTDIALLKVEADEPLPAAQWGESDEARVGNWVLAIGNPFGLVNSLTVGVISAIARDIGAGPFDEFIQTDAAINRGNSGGPLFNLVGEVIGVNTAIYSPSGGSVGVGFAVPSSLARSVVFQLREYGHTRRGWLGVRIQTVTEELAESLGLGEETGALVADTIPNSPAANAGILARDIILTFDGRPVTGMRKLPRMVAETAIGRTVKVEVWRNSEKVVLEVLLGELEEKEPEVSSQTGQPEVQTVEGLGLGLSAITDQALSRFGIGEEVRGVVVVAVQGGSDAAAKGMRIGDVIVEVGQDPVLSPRTVAESVAHHMEEGKNSILLLVNRNGNSLFIALRIDEG